LDDAFFLFPVGNDEFGELFEKRNGSGATVKGITLEARANFDYVFELEAGLTVQSSKFDQAVETIEDLAPKRDFLRTPNEYGYATFTYTPTKNWSASANLVYTGPMDIAHFAGENTGQTIDEYFTTPSFTELSIRLGHTLNINTIGTQLELYGGVKNLTNSYQNDFDTGKNRDSNFVYGPAAPRSIFVGLIINAI
jgi:outer membrane receptor for ferrienterochelin and colicins